MCHTEPKGLRRGDPETFRGFSAKSWRLPPSSAKAVAAEAVIATMRESLRRRLPFALGRCRSYRRDGGKDWDLRRHNWRIHPRRCNYAGADGRVIWPRRPMRVTEPSQARKPSWPVAARKWDFPQIRATITVTASAAPSRRTGCTQIAKVDLSITALFRLAVVGGSGHLGDATFFRAFHTPPTALARRATHATTQWRSGTAALTYNYVHFALRDEAARKNPGILVPRGGGRTPILNGRFFANKMSTRSHVGTAHKP